MDVRYYKDPETDLPHIYVHGVYESEVEDVPRGHGDDYAAGRGARMKIGRTQAGRLLQVIFRQDPESERILVVTAFELYGKRKRAYRRRQRRKRS